jgi:calcium-dependent protein kinase
MKILGEGTYGVARKAIDKDTGEVRAVKTIHRDKIRNYQRFLNEVNALKTLDHPNVVKLFEIYEDDDHVHLVMEYLSGGELFDYIIKQEYLDEYRAAQIFKQILHSVLYCHKNAICHRDLKPENFMFESTSKDANLKLIDFGLSCSYYRVLSSGVGKYTRMTTRAGTAYFIAPEVLEENYSMACDMWSIGVILYIMLCGYPPFDGDTEEEIFKAIQAQKYDFNDEVWEHLSDEAKDLISKLLVPENERLSPKEALKHPWLERLSETDPEDKPKVPLGKTHINRLKNFHKMENFKKVVFTFIASRTSDKEILEEMEAFKKLDKNKDGYITLPELKSALKLGISEEELEDILKGVDTDKNGAINYTEFIAATLNQCLINDKGKIEKAFKTLDCNGDGSINAKDLETLLSGDKLQYFDASIVKDILKE